MSRSWRSRRGAVATVVLALVVAVAPFVIWQGADGGPTFETRPAPEIVVVGDSITARYDDVAGSPDQGWWSFVGRHARASVDTYAQSGSGFLRRGAHCRGTTFAERTAALERPAPAMFIIEGGRNDWAACHDRQVTPATNAEIVTAIRGYLKLVDDTLPPSTRVIVLGPPWGPLQPIERVVVTGVVRQSAELHDFEFIDTTGTLPAENVLDGVHPNRAGNIAIARRVISALG